MFSSKTLIKIIIAYRYPILLPLAFLEGPIISLAVGFLVYLGYFHFLPAYLVLLVGDIIPDIFYYYLGRFGNKRKLVQKYGTNSFIAKNAEFIKRIWHEHGMKTMFVGKLAYGLSSPFLISAGLVNLPFKRFISYAIPVTIFQYAVIMAIGYYLGYSYNSAAEYISSAGIIISIIVILAVAIFFTQKYARKKISKIEEIK